MAAAGFEVQSSTIRLCSDSVSAVPLSGWQEKHRHSYQEKTAAGFGLLVQGLLFCDVLLTMPGSNDSFWKCKAAMCLVGEPRLSPLLAKVAETNLLVQRRLKKGAGNASADSSLESLLCFVCLSPSPRGIDRRWREGREECGERGRQRRREVGSKTSWHTPNPTSSYIWRQLLQCYSTDSTYHRKPKP